MLVRTTCLVPFLEAAMAVMVGGDEGEGKRDAGGGGGGKHQ